jgi:hypothetical protein
MENLEFFNSVDSMLCETLSKKQLKEFCEDFEKEVEANNGKYANDFKLALKMGETGERIVRMFLENLGYVFLSKCVDISHDYKFLKDGKEFVFEIKTDVGHYRLNKKTDKFYDTGNVAIEFECRNKPSGIDATKADFFVTYFPRLNEIWLIKTNKLRKLIEDNKDNIIDTENSGDDESNTRLHLLKRKKFKPEFRVTNLYVK